MWVNKLRVKVHVRKSWAVIWGTHYFYGVLEGVNLCEWGQVQLVLGEVEAWGVKRREWGEAMEREQEQLGGLLGMVAARERGEVQELNEQVGGAKVREGRGLDGARPRLHISHQRDNRYRQLCRSQFEFCRRVEPHGTLQRWCTRP